MDLNESISSAPFGERFNYASRTRLYPFRSKSCARAEFVCAHSEALLECELSSFMTIKGLITRSHSSTRYQGKLFVAPLPLDLVEPRGQIRNEFAVVTREMLVRVWMYRVTKGAHIESFCQVIHSQFGLAIHQNDHQTRRRFVEWAQNEIAVVPHFQKRILFSDEAHFWLNGYVNKQNCRI
ncbi:hypothetical protein TNCV_2440691 [Trichonephila clavipes]|nr:hypothetical protein TNCV_2440691 [Trichonephila clavipes]